MSERQFDCRIRRKRTGEPYLEGHANKPRLRLVESEPKTPSKFQGILVFKPRENSNLDNNVVIKSKETSPAT